MKKDSFVTSLDSGENAAVGVMLYNELLPKLKNLKSEVDFDIVGHLTDYAKIKSSEPCHLCGDTYASKTFGVYYCDETQVFSGFIFCTCCLKLLNAVNPTAFSDGERAVIFKLSTVDQYYEKTIVLRQPKFEKIEPLLIALYLCNMLSTHNKSWGKWLEEENHYTIKHSRVEIFKSYMDEQFGAPIKLDDKLEASNVF